MGIIRLAIFLKLSIFLILAGSIGKRPLIIKFVAVCDFVRKFVDTELKMYDGASTGS